MDPIIARPDAIPTDAGEQRLTQMGEDAPFDCMDDRRNTLSLREFTEYNGLHRISGGVPKRHAIWRGASMSDPIFRLYDAAMGEECWDTAMEMAARQIGASVFILGAGNPRDPEDLQLWSVNWDTAPLFEAGYSLPDVWNPMINPDVAAGLIMPVGRTAHCRQLVPDDVFRASDFLQVTVANAGLRDYRLHVPFRDANLLSGGFFAKGPGADFDLDEVVQLDALLPHVGRALKLRTQINRHRSAACNLSALVEALSYGVMLLDRGGEVILTNSTCDRMLARGDGLSVVRRQPKFGPHADKAIATALSVINVRSGGVPDLQGFPVARSSGLPPYLVRVYPGAGFGSLGGAGSVGVALLIDDPLDPTALPDPLLLQSFFGLSPAEAIVAQLVTRLASRRAMAEHLGLSENTVKTHLASIRDKVGVQTTAELVRVLVRSTVGPPR